MSFIKPGPLVGYVTGDLIDEADINYWCSKFPDCIDGAGGGSYSLSAPLSITGDVVTFDDIEADSLTTSGDVEVGDDLRVLDNANITGGLVVEETLDVTGDVTIEGLTSLNGGVTVDFGIVTDTLVADTGQFFGALQFVFKTSMGPDADTAYSASQSGQIVFVESMTANRAYTLSGLFDAGQWFWFKNRSGAETLTINGSAIENGESQLWVYNGSAWRTFYITEPT